MNLNVVWKGNLNFAGRSEAGHQVLMDAGVQSGGEAKGPQPAEMILMGVGGCAGINIVRILEKMREAVDGFAIEADADQADVEPRRFTTIRLTFKFQGKLKPCNVENAIRLSLDKYSAVVNSLSAGIFFAYEINGVSYPESGFME